MIETFRAAHGLVDARLLPPELERAEALAATKFASAAWTGIVP
jgi:lipoate-protein ligase A